MSNPLASTPDPEAPRIMFWGTYDSSKPRNRILIKGLRENGVEVDECHHEIWENVRDKSTLGLRQVAVHLLLTVAAYPYLLARFYRSPRPTVVLVGYMGQLDVLLLCPFARLRGVPIVWDQFISLYDTVVCDRAKVKPRRPLAKALYAWEWLACRAADRVLIDTISHAAYVQDLFRLPPGRVDSVWVGAETDIFAGSERQSCPGGPLRVLFYGQMIPLHGVETIIHAARLLVGVPVQFLIVGSGQEETLVERLLSEVPLKNLEWRRWVQYERLPALIREADVCLGIFGRTPKAKRVIPNKVFQVIAARRPLVTMDSPAIRELLAEDAGGIWLVPPGDARALADVLASLAKHPERLSRAALSEASERISPAAIGRQLLSVLERVKPRSR